MYMMAIFKTRLKYLRLSPVSLRVVTDDMIKVKLKPFVNWTD